MSSDDCPSEEELFAFIEGKLSGAALDRLANHLTVCTRCQQRLEGLDEPADGVVQALRRPAARDSRQDDEAVRRLLQSSRGERMAAPKYVLPTDLGDYQILGEIGRGGMGVVYRAFDRRRQEVVALKTLQGMDPSLLYRFKQEFRALSGVSHANLVGLHRLVADREVCYFTMELIEGVDFRTHIRGPSIAALHTRIDGSLDDTGHSSTVSPEETPLTGEQVARLRPALQQLAQGLQALHLAGKLHRDLKPANVLVTSQGRTVILDFGLAAQLDPSGRHASTIMIVGTLSYMAPEQADAAPLTPAADWYSVGVMLYEVLVGRTPFNGTTHQVLLDKQRLDPPRPSSIVPGVPEDLERLCMDLLQRKPEARPRGEEVLARLADELTTAPPRTETRRSLFVGRQRELKTLADAFTTLRRGKTIIVQVRGRSGVGKSTLVQQFLADVRTRDAVVLEGRCYEQESVPFKAFDSLVDGLSRYLARLPRPEVEAILPRDVGSLVHVFPVLGQAAALAQAPRRDLPLDPRELRRRAFAALRELLARLGDRRPLILSIDDLQWGDIDSAALLTGLLLPPDPPLLLLLASYRSEEIERSPFLRSFLAEKHSGIESPVVDLSGLSESEAGELARELMREKAEAGEDDIVRAELIARESHGSPLFVQELVQFLSTMGTKTIQGGFSDSELLDEVLWQRVTKLVGPARQLMEVVAVAGRPLQEEDAARAVGLVGMDRTILAQLRAERLLRGTGASSGEEVETYHDRVRETIQQHLSQDERREHHRRLADVLAGAARGRTGVSGKSLAWCGTGTRGREVLRTCGRTSDDSPRV